MLMTYSLAGVLHAAGVLRDKILRSMPASDLEASFSPKASAASHLHSAALRGPLDAMGLFSSAAATFGNIGQGNYAAANAHLDGLVLSRRMHGLIGSSLQIGAVRGAGMGATTFDKEQLDGMGAVSLNEFAAHLASSLARARATGERTEALVSPELIEYVAAMSPALSEIYQVMSAPLSLIHISEPTRPY